jgi:hypothetical protein
MYRSFSAAGFRYEGAALSRLTRPAPAAENAKGSAHFLPGGWCVLEKLDGLLLSYL